jgi:hypothetical protein
MFEQNKPGLAELDKSFLNCSYPDRLFSGKCLAYITRISYENFILRDLSLNGRCRRAPCRRSLFAIVICRPFWAALNTREVKNCTYKQGLRASSDWGEAVDPVRVLIVILLLLTMKMEFTRGVRKASSRAPGVSEKAISGRDLTDGRRAFSLRRRGEPFNFSLCSRIVAWHLAARAIPRSSHDNRSQCAPDETRIVRI